MTLALREEAAPSVAPSPQEILNTFKMRMTELQELSQKIAELENERREHQCVRTSDSRELCNVLIRVRQTGCEHNSRHGAGA